MNKNNKSELNIPRNAVTIKTIEVDIVSRINLSSSFVLTQKHDELSISSNVTIKEQRKTNNNQMKSNHHVMNERTTQK